MNFAYGYSCDGTSVVAVTVITRPPALHIEVQGFVFLASKVAFSRLPVDRIGKQFWGKVTLGQVKSVPNFC